MKKNCWEFMKCGRQPGGKYALPNPCPASVEKRFDGVHGGQNAGRTCWVVAGTMCGGDARGKFALQHKNCGSCEFYLHVREEEPGFMFALTLLNIRKMPIAPRPIQKPAHKPAGTATA